MKLAMRKMLCFACVLCLCFSLAVPTWAADGNPLAGASSMGSSGTVQGTITDDNKADYYKYTVAAGSSVELDVTYTSHIGYSQFNIYDATGNKVYDSSLVADGDTNQATKKYNLYLNPGVYYIGVGFADEGSYSFSYNTKKLNNTDVAYDNTVASAHSLPLTTTVNGVISEISDDEIDIYKLEVKNPGVIKYDLKFYMSTLRFKLLDETGNEIESNFYIWNDNLKQGVESFEYALESGTYYISVLRGNDDGKYSFKQTFTEINSTENEPNDEIESAQSINLGEKVSGLIGVNGDTDFYKVVIPSKRNITFSVTSKISSMYLYLYDKDGEQIKRDYIWWNDNTKSATLKKIYKLPAGVYYLQIKNSYSNYNGAYTLTASTTKAPTQSKITTIKRTKKDWFGNRSIYLKYNKSTNAEGYQIYVAKNSKFKGASKYTSDKRTATVGSFAVGKTYYVKVRGYSKNSDGEYIYGKFSAVKKVKL